MQSNVTLQCHFLVRQSKSMTILKKEKTLKLKPEAITLAKYLLAVFSLRMRQIIKQYVFEIYPIYY